MGETVSHWIPASVIIYRDMSDHINKSDGLSLTFWIIIMALTSLMIKGNRATNVEAWEHVLVEDCLSDPDSFSRKT